MPSDSCWATAQLCRLGNPYEVARRVTKASRFVWRALSDYQVRGTDRLSTHPST